MTEDDTFRVLARRIPFYEMMKMYRTGAGRGRYDEWFAEYGWNWNEFSKEWRNWNGGVGTYSDFEKSKQ